MMMVLLPVFVHIIAIFFMYLVVEGCEKTMNNAVTIGKTGTRFRAGFIMVVAYIAIFSLAVSLVEAIPDGAKFWRLPEKAVAEEPTQ